jgi:ABC-2 type transport system ATP-binding protein
VPGDTQVNAVRVAGLSKRYGGVAAVDDLSFEVRAGAVTGFLGPNGAGKTTTLRILLGLARPSAGEATIFGQPFAALADPARTVGASLEISGFHPGRSGRNHLRSLAVLAGLPESRVEDVLKLVELTGAADRRAGKASGWRSRRRSWGTRSCSYSTSRPMASTHRAFAGCATSCAGSPPKAARC